jgi:hypothetical protein
MAKRIDFKSFAYHARDVVAPAQDRPQWMLDKIAEAKRTYAGRVDPAGPSESAPERGTCAQGSLFAAQA